MGVMGKLKKYCEMFPKKKTCMPQKNLVFFKCHVNSPRETLIKKRKKYMSKNIGYNILVVR